MALKLYNTLTREKDQFKAIHDNSVRMYNCGPTVYNLAHIGNFRAFVASDILKRYMLYKGMSVKQVMNITDVDDKTIRDSQKEGVSLKVFTERYTKIFLDDMKTLNIAMPEVMPKATDHIPEMVSLIKTLLDKGYAYRAKDGIYFSIAKFKDYGKLSKIKQEEMKAGARVSSDEYNKESANDFALWKFWDKKDGDVFWETEIGKGRPGWHIECSAMSIKYLGIPFDIHTGGIDLVFPHHENEIAQSEAAFEMEFVHYWLHNEYILVDGKKMSKSLGNFYTLHDVLKKGYKPMAIRYLLLSSNYRQQLNFTLEGLDAAQKSVDRLNELLLKLKSVSINESDSDHVDHLITKTREAFETAMDDDLNTSGALSAIFDFVRDINKGIAEEKIGQGDTGKIYDFLKKIDLVLGVMDFSEEEVPKAVVLLAEQRLAARKDKNFKLADELRHKIKEHGYTVDDTPQGYQLKKIE